MAKIMLVLEVSDEEADPDHPSGLTEEANDLLVSRLVHYEIVSGPSRVGSARFTGEVTI